jgi:hypothetical protein
MSDEGTRRPARPEPVITIYSASSILANIAAAPAPVPLPDVVIPAGIIPRRARIIRVEIILRWRKLVNTNALVNQLNADTSVQVRKSVAGIWTNGISLLSGMWTVPALVNTENYGNEIVGEIDVKAEVSADGLTYNLQIVNAAAAQNNLVLDDVQTAIRLTVS